MFLRFIILFTAISISVSISAQQIKTYATHWKKVKDLIEKQNLPKSALAEVRKIYQLAKTEKQDAQVIKSLVYMVQLQQENREDNILTSIAELEKEMAISKEPVTSILKSLLADVYLNYYHQHRWQLLNRTTTDNFSKTDIATWTSEELHRQITSLYLQSISNARLLQQVKLEPFDAIITKGNTRTLRPTLYDLLAFRALNYFGNPERDIKKPAYAFEITEPRVFSPAEEFIRLKIQAADSISAFYRAIGVYQELLRFHLNDAKPEALIDADLHRLSFMRDKSVIAEKDSLYKQALQHIITKYKYPVASQAGYYLARMYEEEANRYSPHGDTTTRYARLRAREIATAVVNASKSGTEGYVHAKNLLIEIERKQLSFQVEKVNVPAQPFRVLINYRNISQVHFKIIAATDALKNALEQDHQKFWNLIDNAPALKSWSQSLPQTNDLQNHAIELKVDALNTGDYILLASSKQSLEELSGARMFHVSNISYVHNLVHHFVLNRETGLPLVGANVQVWQHQYDYKTSRYENQKTGTYKTDEKGYFRLPATKDSRDNAYMLDISHGKDKLFINEFLHRYDYIERSPNPNNIKPNTYLFTDRSIYRPGQLVYFKGLVITNQGKNNKVEPGYSQMVYLRNANYQFTDSVLLKTNEFGSFNGRFTLPQGVLNGVFYIVTNKATGEKDIRVEEYKRPKYVVEFEKLKGDYKVEQKVTVQGKARAYAGNNINDAKVVYRVTRIPRFIYPWLYWRSWLPQAAPMEIAHGETKTDENGMFTISFTAIPDKTIDRMLDPLFDYKVHADVTDLSGETRSAEKTVTVGYKALVLQLNIPPTVEIDSFRHIHLTTQNLSGEFQPATIKISIHRLQPENRLVRARFWQRPDQFIMSKEEYLRLFPYDEYDNENDPSTWRRIALVYEKTDSSRVNSRLPINPSGISSGHYVVEAETRDKDGNIIKNMQFIEIFDRKSNVLPRKQYLWTKASDAIEPGERTDIGIGSSANDVFIVQTVDKNVQTVNSTDQRDDLSISTFSLSDSKRFNPFSASEFDRGGYGVSYIFVKHNRAYIFQDVIMVPWTNKDLQVEYATFRDKTLPGSEEKWKLILKGYKNEKVAGEMLASMYDASLDQFAPHSWTRPSIWPIYFNRTRWDAHNNFSDVQSIENWKNASPPIMGHEKRYDELIVIHYYPFHTRYDDFARPEMQEVVVTGYGVRQTGAVTSAKKGIAPPPSAGMEDAAANQSADGSDKEEQQQPQSPDVVFRKNFNETAFFFPELYAKEDGSIELSFTVPDALTTWKLQTFTHTKELAFGVSEKEIITQKKLMVQPNMPRFLREGDKIELSARVSNLSDKEMTGQAELILLDATTNQPIGGLFQNVFPNQYFTVAAGKTEAVSFPLEIPFNFNKPLTWRIVARSNEFSDGEEDIVPILTNRTLVTETFPLPMRGDGTKKFEFTKLKNAEQSESLKHHAFTVEYTSNPAWFPIQAIPYLMEQEKENAEQAWNRFYANALASHIVTSGPRIKQVFETWKTKDTAALISNLQKNQELKALLLEETPWVMQAQNETQQRKNIALLFDMYRMSTELASALEKLKQLHAPNGGFVWFKGGPDDRYMTQYIVTGIGHLQKLVPAAKNIQGLQQILQTAIPYLDRRIKEDYDYLVKQKVDLNKQQIGNIQIQYLYMRSFFPTIKGAPEKAYTYYSGQAKKYWMKFGKYMQGMLALHFFRSADQGLAKAIVASLKETSINHEELGMYWKDQPRGWFWHQAPIETQSLLIEAFHEITKDNKAVDDMRTWLLRNKHTNNWKTSKATADAVYALLLQGTNWLASEPTVEIKFGNKNISTTSSKTEAGTGYLKETIAGDMVRPSMGDINVNVSNTPLGTVQSSWGAVYWQYFEDLDKITSAETPLQLSKKLFLEKNTDRGPVITPITDGQILSVGDKIKVRIELRVDREMEYVHMKDMRASALEPVNVLSGYRWQGGLGYYETTKDASTNFFFGQLRRGTYVFEYPLFVSHAGSFSNGITTIQSMYAPEYTSHSEGVRISVEK